MKWYEVKMLIQDREGEISRWAMERQALRLAGQTFRQRLGRWLLSSGEALLRPFDSSPSSLDRGDLPNS